MLFELVRHIGMYWACLNKDRQTRKYEDIRYINWSIIDLYLIYCTAHHYPTCSLVDLDNFLKFLKLSQHFLSGKNLPPVFVIISQISIKIEWSELSNKSYPSKWSSKFSFKEFNIWRGFLWFLNGPSEL